MAWLLGPQSTSPEQTRLAQASLFSVVGRVPTPTVLFIVSRMISLEVIPVSVVLLVIV